MHEMNHTGEYTTEGEHHDESLLSKRTQSILIHVNVHSFHNKIPTLLPSLTPVHIAFLFTGQHQRVVSKWLQNGESNPSRVAKSQRRLGLRILPVQ